jgi:hypothetical protein
MLYLLSVIISAILRSAQKYCTFVNSLTAARKQKGRKSNKNTSEVHTLRFPHVHMPNFRFISYLFLELEFNTQTHTHFILFIWYKARVMTRSVTVLIVAKDKHRFENFRSNHLQPSYSTRPNSHPTRLPQNVGLHLQYSTGTQPTGRYNLNNHCNKNLKMYTWSFCQALIL